MKKKLISIITAITFCFIPVYSNNILTTQVNASDTIQFDVRLKDQAKGGSYNIILTDDSFNSITQTIPTSGSIATFTGVDCSKNYTISVYHTSNDNALYYFGKHNFTTEHNAQMLTLTVTDTPIERHTLTKNNESLTTDNAKISVAGAYANINSINNIYSNYITPFISTDFKYSNVLTTFSMNGYVTGDEYAVLNVDLLTDLPEFYAIFQFDRYNTLQATYYNTNSFPIIKESDTSFNLYLNDFTNTTNFAVIELSPQNEIEYNFGTPNYTISNINYKDIETSYNDKIYSTTNHITTGSIPTTGYISVFRNVTIGDTINLDNLNIPGVTGWYYDIVYKNPVNSSSIVVTKDILINGLYPKFGSSSGYVFVK